MEKSRKNELENKKKLTIIGIILGILLVITIILIFNENNENYYIILDNHGIIEYKNETYNYTEEKKYLKSLYKVYNDNNYLGTYTIHKVDDFTKEIFFTNVDSEGSYAFEKPLLAITDNIEKIEYKLSDFTDSDFYLFNDIAMKSYIKDKNDLYDTSKVVLDFDNDNKNETLYTVTYEDLENDYVEVGENNYSIMYYMDDNGELTILAQGEPYYEGESILFPNYMIKTILDVNNDDIYEIVVINRMHDEPVYEIYAIKDNVYTMVFATDLGGV